MCHSEELNHVKEINTLPRLVHLYHFLFGWAARSYRCYSCKSFNAALKKEPGVKMLRGWRFSYKEGEQAIMATALEIHAFFFFFSLQFVATIRSIQQNLLTSFAKSHSIFYHVIFPVRCLVCLPGGQKLKWILTQNKKEFQAAIGCRAVLLLLEKKNQKKLYISLMNCCVFIYRCVFGT